METSENEMCPYCKGIGSVDERLNGMQLCPWCNGSMAKEDTWNHIVNLHASAIFSGLAENQLGDNASALFDFLRVSSRLFVKLAHLRNVNTKVLDNNLRVWAGVLQNAAPEAPKVLIEWLRALHGITQSKLNWRI